MVRLLLRLFNVKDFEPCKSCETLRAQLEYANANNKELTETLLQILKPTVAAPLSDTKIIAPVAQSLGSFGRRKGLLEEMHKVKREITQTSPFIAKADKPAVTDESIQAMESKLNLNEDQSNAV